MKRIFCDCCDKEMDYNTDQPNPFTSGGVGVSMGKTPPKWTGLEVKIDVRMKNGTTNQNGVREHMDVCHACRWAAVDLIISTHRARHPIHDVHANLQLKYSIATLALTEIAGCDQSAEELADVAVTALSALK